LSEWDETGHVFKDLLRFSVLICRDLRYQR